MNRERMIRLEKNGGDKGLLYIEVSAEEKFQRVEADL